MLTTRADLILAGVFLEREVRKSASALSSQSDLFLSHASADIGRLTSGAIRILSAAGAKVYADILDPDAPTEPSELGAFFAQAIRDTERLVVLLTGNVKRSRWVPWELGFAHALHDLSRVALWPVVDDPGAPNEWVYWDYLALYPRIERIPSVGPAVYGVVEPHEPVRYWPLETWLRPAVQALR
jgi:hypothetical protein